jgi:hypothetical protein
MTEHKAYMNSINSEGIRIYACLAKEKYQESIHNTSKRSMMIPTVAIRKCY